MSGRAWSGARGGSGLSESSCPWGPDPAGPRRRCPTARARVSQGVTIVGECPHPGRGRLVGAPGAPVRHLLGRLKQSVALQPCSVVLRTSCPNVSTVDTQPPCRREAGRDVAPPDYGEVAGPRTQATTSSRYFSWSRCRRYPSDWRCRIATELLRGGRARPLRRSPAVSSRPPGCRPVRNRRRCRSRSRCWRLLALGRRRG